jgi:hypothetical protein
MMYTVFLLAMAVISANANVCFPSFEKRAFVTTLSNTDENLLKIQVLYRSLRMNKAKEDVVVIVLETLLTPALHKELSSFGFVIYPIKKKMLEQHAHPQELSIWAFEMIQYERVVYLDPYSLVLDNIDELFACVGYCASLNSKKTPVVLEPSLKTFTSLNHNFRKSSNDFMESLQLIMNLESCPTFSQQVVVNAETSEQCFNKDKDALLLTECHQLPREYGVLSGEFAAQSMHKDLVCTTCGFEKPKIITYPAIEDSWESFMKTRKAIFSKWDDVRSTIPISGGMRKDSLMSFSVAIFFSFCILYFHQQRCLLSSNKQSVSFALPLSAFSELPSLSGTSLVCESISCAVVTPLSPTSSQHVLANKSSLHLFFVVLVTTMVASSWYHLSLTIGQYSSSFEWDPLAALAVGYGWTTLLLLMGLRLTDHVHELFQSDVCLLFQELGIMLCSGIVIIVVVPKDQHFVFLQALLCVLAVVLSVSYLRRPPSSPALVQSQDISVLLSASLAYFVSSYSLILLNISVVLRTVIIRSLGMVHFSVFLFVVISVISGEHLSGIIRKATLPKRDSSINVVKYLKNIAKCMTQCCCSLKKYLLNPFNLVLLCCAIVIIIIYIKLFLARGSNLPITSPYFCLHQRGKYLNAEGGVSSGCGAREAFSIQHSSDSVFSETFSQKYICVENTKPVPRLHRSHYNNGKRNWWDLVFANSAGGDNSTMWWWESKFNKEKERKYLFPSLLANNKNQIVGFPHCVPDTQFVFILPPEKESKKQFCLYNSRNGNFLTSSTSKRNFCGQTEKWEVIPTHTYIYAFNKIVSLLHPLKYRFTYLHPLSSVGLMILLSAIARKVQCHLYVCMIFVSVVLMSSSGVCFVLQVGRYPYIKVTLYSTVAVLFLYLFHVGTIWVIWGNNFDKMRQYNTDTMLSFQKTLGILTGPQYFRTITMLPDECPETLWFVSLVVFSSTFPVFLVLLSCIQKRKLSVVDEEFLHFSRDSRDDFDDDVQSEKDLNFNVSIMSRVASCAIGSLLLETLLSLVLPVQFVASAYTSKSSCANFEDRFEIISFDKEYMDTVVLFANIIFLMGMKYSTSPFFFSFCIVYSLILYMLVWLTVECSYVLFISKFCITIVAWISISHKLSSYFEFLILKKTVLHVGKEKMGQRHKSMPNFFQEDKQMISSPKYKQLTRNQSSYRLKEHSMSMGD